VRRSSKEPLGRQEPCPDICCKLEVAGGLLDIATRRVPDERRLARAHSNPAIAKGREKQKHSAARLAEEVIAGRNKYLKRDANRAGHGDGAGANCARIGVSTRNAALISEEDNLGRFGRAPHSRKGAWAGLDKVSIGHAVLRRRRRRADQCSVDVEGGNHPARRDGGERRARGHEAVK
jgi:hypothetical protein